jgi:hypothetical protein
LESLVPSGIVASQKVEGLDHSRKYDATFAVVGKEDAYWQSVDEAFLRQAEDAAN